jgi:predicted CXXCH cytochrome family protein
MARVLPSSVLLPLALCTLSAQTDPGSRYVDSKICATCHREIAAKYARTGMARSFYKPAAAKTIEDYAGTPQYYHALSDSHYSMTIRNGLYFQRRWQIGLGGKEINAEEVSVDYVIGSGNHARFYLHRTEQGMLIELPLGWYPQKGGEWGMVPGSDLPQPKTRQFIAYKCMFCHNAYPNIPGGQVGNLRHVDAPGDDPVFLGDLPEGIDCQRCHGPGGEHVRTYGRAAIVNPAKLSFERRMEVCLQCHLEPTGGDIPAKLQRFSRGTFSFIPGQPLADYTVFFDYAPGRREDRFEGVGTAYQFRKSRCFLESGGKLECGSCHDPHDVPRGAEAVLHYSGVCLQCHAAAAHPAVGRQVTDLPRDCVTCHMPKRRADDAPHMIFTDHRIQRRPPPNALAEFAEKAPEPYHGEVVPYYPVPLPETPENALYRAVAQVGMGNNVEAGMPDLVRLLDKIRPGQPEFYMVLGDGWKKLGKPREAAAAYEQALRLQPGSPRAMRALAAAELDAGKSGRAEEILARAVQIAPDDPQSWFQYGAVTSSPTLAAERIRKAIALNPWFRDQYRKLAEVTHSEPDLKDALRADPFDDAAWDLGGRIMAEKGDWRESFFDFERAVKIRPEGTYFFDYALALARADRFEEAQTEAEMAARADVNLADAHELLGGLHARKKELTEAAGEYMAALALKPQLWRVHLRLGMVLASKGDKDAAELHLRAAAQGDDAATARQATQALDQLANH